MLMAALVVCGAAVESRAQETTLYVSAADYANRLMPDVRIRVTDMVSGELVATVTTGENGTADVRVASSHASQSARKQDPMVRTAWSYPAGTASSVHRHNRDTSIPDRGPRRAS